MPHTAALIFCRNDKAGSYCGFFKHINATMSFHHKDFLAANALPGPGSLIQCLQYPNGANGGYKQFKLKKEQPFSQIPSLNYRLQHVANLPRPK